MRLESYRRAGAQSFFGWSLLALVVVSRIPEGLSGQTGPTSVSDVASEVVAFRSGESGTAGFAPLGAAPDSLLGRWYEALRDVHDPPDPLLQSLLIEMIEQARAIRHCPSEPGEEHVPAGASCYGALLRVLVGLELAPREVHDIGVDMRLDLERRIVELAERHLGASSSVEARAILTDGAAYRFPSGDAMRDEAAAYLARARAAMPRLVHVVPDDSLELVVVSEEQGAQIAAAAFYNRARDDRPARFYLNTVQADARPRGMAATAAFHEGWPGHHFQAARNADLPSRHEAVRGLPVTAYVEGWGLYSEMLADEVDLYPTPEDRISYLLHLQDAMVALQVDAGLHALGWSRAEAVDTMVFVGGRPRAQAEQYADRHLATPGQMVSYLLGFREILRLRESAARRLGPDFDIRDFHEALLSEGPVPLGLLPRIVDRGLEAPGPGEAAPRARGALR